MVSTKELNKFEDMVRDFLNSLEINNKTDFQNTLFDLQSRFEDILIEFENEKHFANIYDYEEYENYMYGGFYD